MKITWHKKIAEYFGYEFVRISRKSYQDINLHLMQLFNFLDINCVLDVGANMGQYAQALRRTGYLGSIISFEPISECCHFLEGHKDDNWHIMNMALGSSEGKIDLHVTKKNVFSSFLKPNQYSEHRFNESAKTSHIETVEVKRLDDILEQIVPDLDNTKLFLKLDTQGYDLEVLKGAKNSLKYIAGIQSEISCKAIYEGMPTHVESLNYINELGYELTNIFPLSHDKHDMSLLECDCVFKKKYY